MSTPRTLLAGALAAALLIASPPPASASERSESARRGAEYLVAHQAEDGTFFGSRRAHHVAETLVALVAAGITGPPVERALSYIGSQGPEAARRAGEAGWLVMGIAAAGEDPHDFHGHDFVEDLQSFYVPIVGVYDTQMFQNALAFLGAIAGGVGVPDEALRFLRLTRCLDGGIPIQAPCGGGAGHVDVTALMLNLLVGAGVPESDPLRVDARSFLAAAQNEEGGFGDARDRPTSANSTGLALTALAALGEEATEPPWRQPDGDHPVRALLGLQQVDGRFRAAAIDEGDVFLATRQAIPGVARVPHPVLPTAGAQ